MRTPLAAGVETPGAADVGWWRQQAPLVRRREGRLAFAATVILTVVQLAAPQIYVPGARVLRFALVAAALALVTLIAERGLRGRPITIVPRELWIVAALFGWAALTVPFSYWPGGSVTTLLGLYFKSLVIFWLLMNTVTSVARLRTIAAVLTVTALLAALTALLHYADMSAGTGRIAGYDAPLTANPNDLALTLNLVLPLTAALLLLARSVLARAALLGVLAVEAAAVVATFSRAGFLTLLVVFLGFLVKFRRRLGPAAAIAGLLVALVAVPLLPASYLQRVATIGDIDADETGSAEARWSDTLTAVGLVVRSPLVGSGIGANILALNAARGAMWREVHNVYLEYAVDLGAPGLLLFVALFASCVRAAQVPRAAETGEDAALWTLGSAVQVSLVGFAVGALFYPVAYQAQFYYFAGLAVAVRAIGAPGAAPPARGRAHR